MQTIVITVPWWLVFCFAFLALALLVFLLLFLIWAPGRRKRRLRQEAASVVPSPSPVATVVAAPVAPVTAEVHNYCSACGIQILSKYQFCPKCGEKLQV